MDLRHELESITRSVGPPPELADLERLGDARRRRTTRWLMSAVIVVIVLGVGIASLSGGSGGTLDSSSAGDDAPYRVVTISVAGNLDHDAITVDLGGASSLDTSPLNADAVFSQDLVVSNAGTERGTVELREISAAVEPGGSLYMGTQSRGCEPAARRVCDSRAAIAGDLEPGDLLVTPTFIDLGELLPGQYAHSITVVWTTSFGTTELPVSINITVAATAEPPAVSATTTRAAGG